MNRVRFLLTILTFTAVGSVWAYYKATDPVQREPAPEKTEYVWVNTPMLYSTPLLFPVAEVDRTEVNTYTFQVDEVEVAEELLPEIPYAAYAPYLGKKTLWNASAKEEALAQLQVYSQQSAHVVQLPGPEHFSFNQFMLAMHMAYNDHRPFVISPDHVWLLICQGFAQHVSLNTETYRVRLNLPEEKTLIEVDNSTNQYTWSEVMEQVARECGEQVSPELFEIVMTTFSTSTPMDHTVRSVAFGDLLSDFTNVVVYGACGFPEITLEGTPADWKLLKVKVQQLGEYGLDWWVKELDPILDECILAAEGKENRVFWQSMYKESSNYSRTTFNGWIKTFFPYVATNIMDGPQQNTFDKDTFVFLGELPKGLSMLDFTYKLQCNDYPMKFQAGFSGIVQDPNTKALRVQMNWMITDTRPAKKRVPRVSAEALLPAI